MAGKSSYDTKHLLEEMQYEISDDVDDITHADITTFKCKVCGHEHIAKFGYRIYKYRTKNYRGCAGCEEIERQNERQKALAKMFEPMGVFDLMKDFITVITAEYHDQQSEIIDVVVMCATCGHQYHTNVDVIKLYHKLSKGTHVGCHKCAEHIPKNQQTVDTINQRATSKEFTIISPVSTWSFPVELKCNLCGHVTITDPKRVFSGNKARICYGCNIKSLNDDSRAKFEERIKGLNVEIVEYDGYAKNGLFRCTIDGHVWRTTPKKIAETLTGSDDQFSGCVKCYQKRYDERHAHIRQGRREFIEESFIIHNYQDFSGVDEITVTNKRCGHTFTRKTVMFTDSKIECPICRGERSHNNSITRNKYGSEEYFNNDVDLEKYSKTVRRMTRTTAKYGGYCNYDSDTQQLDHIVSVKLCYYRNVPSAICANPANLELIGQRVNLIKRQAISKIPDVLAPYFQRELEFEADILNTFTQYGFTNQGDNPIFPFHAVCWKGNVVVIFANTKEMSYHGESIRITMAMQRNFPHMKIVQIDDVNWVNQRDCIIAQVTDRENVVDLDHVIIDNDSNADQIVLSDGNVVVTLIMTNRRSVYYAYVNKPAYGVVDMIQAVCSERKITVYLDPSCECGDVSDRSKDPEYMHHYTCIGDDRLVKKMQTKTVDFTTLKQENWIDVRSTYRPAILIA